MTGVGSKIVFEDEKVKVWEFNLEPGEKTPLHTHELDYVFYVIDGANLFHAGQLPRMREILDEAFDLLGDDIRMAHAKDLERDGDAGHQAAGTGVLDYAHYLALLQSSAFDGALILHSLGENQVLESLAFVREKMAS